MNANHDSPAFEWWPKENSKSHPTGPDGKPICLDTLKLANHSHLVATLCPSFSREIGHPGCSFELITICTALIFFYIIQFSIYQGDSIPDPPQKKHRSMVNAKVVACWVECGVVSWCLILQLVQVLQWVLQVMLVPLYECPSVMPGGLHCLVQESGVLPWFAM